MLVVLPPRGRYLPHEVLNDDLSALDKADMFALGATLLELATNSPLPSGAGQGHAPGLGVIGSSDRYMYILHQRTHATLLELATHSPLPSGAGRGHAPGHGVISSSKIYRYIYVLHQRTHATGDSQVAGDMCL